MLLNVLDRFLSLLVLSVLLLLEFFILSYFNLLVRNLKLSSSTLVVFPSSSSFWFSAVIKIDFPSLMVEQRPALSIYKDIHENNSKIRAYSSFWLI